MRAALLLSLVLLAAAPGCPSATSIDGDADADADSDADAFVVWECVDPVERYQAGVEPPTPTGFVTCANGMIHRIEAVRCLNPDAAEPDLLCREDFNDDCTDHPYGRCLVPRCHPSCVYGCETDADCRSDQICACADGTEEFLYTSCIQAYCTTTGDCEEGQFCSLSPSVCRHEREPGHWYTSFVECTTDHDECMTAAECPPPDCSQFDDPEWCATYETSYCRHGECDTYDSQRLCVCD